MTFFLVTDGLKPVFFSHLKKNIYIYIYIYIYKRLEHIHFDFLINFNTIKIIIKKRKH